MDSKLLIIVLLAIATIGSVVAGTVYFTAAWKKDAPSTCDAVLTQINYVWLPESITNITMGKNINLHFAMINGDEISYTGVVGKGALRNLRCGRSEDYDFEVWMDDASAFQLATSIKPITDAVRLWRSGKITIKANGAENEKVLGYADRLVAQDNEPVPGPIRSAFGYYVR